jgi:hypothetical protein
VTRFLMLHLETILTGPGLLLPLPKRFCNWYFLNVSQPAPALLQERQERHCGRFLVSTIRSHLINGSSCDRDNALKRETVSEGGAVL